MEDAERMKSRLREDKSIKLKQTEEIDVILLSLNEINLGEIKEVNNYAANFFGYIRKEALHKRINDFMPKIFADNHDAYLQRFSANPNKQVNTDDRLLLGKHRNHSISPIKLQLRRQFSTSSDDILFMASIKQVKFGRAEMYCLIDEEGIITGMSASFKYIFKIEGTNCCIDSIIKNFWSLIVTDAKLVNNFLLTLGLWAWGYPSHSVDIYVSSLTFPSSENIGYVTRGEIIKNFQEYKKK
jgi:hypothetical protein